MRELKFRAWDKKKKEFIDWFDISCVGVVWTQKINCDPEYPDVVIEQCTGLKDKNGREIYDGDLLKFEDSIFKIGWYDEGARFGFVPIKKCNFSMGFSLSKCEVIGNTHNKPELLEEE